MNEVSQGQAVEVILRETPFYAEGGGQVGDTGIMEGATGDIRVEDTQSPVTGVIVHRGRVANGTVAKGDEVVASVDGDRRLDAARNHTATHLLHAALRAVLGSHVRQAGSLVAPDRLRFDFTHVSPLTLEETGKVEALVNERIRANVPVRKRETSFREAVSEGALAFFGDRYADEVRVVEIANGDRFSFEVCGGTHVRATGDIGYCRVTGESSIGAGMRRLGSGNRPRRRNPGHGKRRPAQPHIEQAGLVAAGHGSQGGLATGRGVALATRGRRQRASFFQGASAESAGGGYEKSPGSR